MPAPHYRIKKDSYTWTPDGGAAVPLLGATDISIDKGGETYDLKSDASIFIQEAPIVGESLSFSLSGVNQGHAAALDIGAGALAFTLERVKTGKGAVAGADIVVTMPNCNLKRISASFTTTAGGGVDLGGEAYDDGTGSLWSVS